MLGGWCSLASSLCMPGAGLLKGFVLVIPLCMDEEAWGRELPWLRAVLYGSSYWPGSSHHMGSEGLGPP